MARRPASHPAEEIQMQLSLVVALPKFSLLQVRCTCAVLRSPLLEEEGPLSLVVCGVSLSLSPCWHLALD